MTNPMFADGQILSAAQLNRLADAIRILTLALWRYHGLADSCCREITELLAAPAPDPLKVVMKDG